MIICDMKMHNLRGQTGQRRTEMLSTSDKVKLVDVVEDAARWHGTIDTKSVDAVDVAEDTVGMEQ